MSVARAGRWLLALLVALALPGGAVQLPEGERELRLRVAREIMAAARFCALITTDAEGRPHARAMEPFPPEADLTVWLGTRRGSRKLDHLRRDPRVALYYFDADRPGYVTLHGEARIVDDPAAAARWWKPEWQAFYPDREASYLLLAVEPVRIEVVSEPDGVVGDAATWSVPTVELSDGGAE